MAEEKNPVGQPTKYSNSITKEICDRLSDGESLEKICKDAHMPSTSCLRVWKNKYPEYMANYARAREDQGDHFGQKVPTTAKRCEDGELPPDVARVVIDAYKWTAARMNRATYGDKQVIESKNTNINLDVGEISDAELLKIIKE